MENKKIVKLAVIREDQERPCPFGLPITDACCNVGKFIDNMVATNKMEDEEEKKVTNRANNRTFIFSKDKDDKKCESKCKYANHIFKDDKVECSYGHYGQGVGNYNANPGPLMNTYLGVGYNSQYYTVPYNTSFEGYNTYYFANQDEQDIEKQGVEEKDVEEKKKEDR